MNSIIGSPSLASFYAVSKTKIAKRKAFFKKPFTPNGIMFGFLFRFIVCIFAVTTSIFIALFCGFLNDWIFNESIMYFTGCWIFANVLLGEYLRSSIYDKVHAAQESNLSRIAKYKNFYTIHNGGMEELYLNVLKSSMSYSRRTKRYMDIFVAATALFFLFPLIILITVLIKLDSNGPAIFGIKHKTLSGRNIKLLKFRTVRISAFKEKTDEHFTSYIRARSTIVGRFLTRSSLDELPMIYNVLRGDISLVGPQISPILEIEQRNSKALGKFKIGLVSYATIKAFIENRRPSIDDEIWYVKNASLWLDIRVIIMALIAVLFKGYR